MSQVSSIFNDTATTEIYTLSLHGARPISAMEILRGVGGDGGGECSHVLFMDDDIDFDPDVLVTTHAFAARTPRPTDRKSTRLNSSHANISYAVFCLKKNNLQNVLYHVSTP